MGDGAAWGVRLSYAVEDEPLGTGGRGAQRGRTLADGRVLVLNGDILTDADLGAMLAFHRARGSAATLYLTRVRRSHAPYGLVELGEGGRVRRFIEKPDPSQITTDTVNAGVYVLDRRLLARIPPGRAGVDRARVLPRAARGPLPFFGWVAEHYWLDIGSPAKYRQGAARPPRRARRHAAVARGRAGGGRFAAPGAVLEPPRAWTRPPCIGAAAGSAAGAPWAPPPCSATGCVVGGDAAVAERPSSGSAWRSAPARELRRLHGRRGGVASARAPDRSRRGRPVRAPWSPPGAPA